ncbi:class D beta-lactamase [Falsihalocynthiibacter arcticus]|uniref:beta-lactamase n=1 Tax=Falsihalocynthiibacter arcticus TaxID=1579316 RepID=A0A126V740_9RHOB|nr:class D beta-lactamase [Falsihalocynthiibacter arcticus]AML53795.1 class D beta-lactamase [Falsihalocynthiibacter arcticus]
MRRLIFVLAFLASLVITSHAEAKEVCTIVMDELAVEVLLRNGDCDSRVTPASTFKISLALMGFDAGVLQDAYTPRLQFREGYPDWGGDNWRQTTDPQRWMKYSVVWFSRQITPILGIPRLTEYASSFGYGNADFSGDFAQTNGLERAWMTSSLQISPREQINFLSRMLRYELPVSKEAVDRTLEIIEFTDTAGSWRVWGKTGTAYPRGDTGRFDYSQGWGWFVGWARRGETKLVFAHLIQDEQRHAESPGLRARATFIGGFDDLVAEALK